MSEFDKAAEVEAKTPITVGFQEPTGPLSFEEARMFHEGFGAGATAYCAAVGHSCLKSDNDRLCEVLTKQGWATIEVYERLPPMPPQLEKHIADWLISNEKMPEQVCYGSFPLGMVQRWIERAEKAERSRDRSDEIRLRVTLEDLRTAITKHQEWYPAEGGQEHFVHALMQTYIDKINNVLNATKETT